MGLKPKSVDFDYTQNEINYIIKDVEFDLIIADFDTPLYQAANAVQETYVDVIFKHTGKVKEFKNQTEFWGHWKKKEGGWLAELNNERLKKGLKKFTPDDFEVVEKVRLCEGIDHIQEALKQFDYAVGKLKKSIKANGYKLLIGGKETNFRYAQAHIQPYKGQRKDKPLLFVEVRDAVIEKYGKYIEFAEGQEADDLAGIYGFENYKYFKRTGKWKYVLAYCDKDLDMIISPSFNYNKPELGITYTDEFEGARCFAVQLLCGDKGTDNIEGLPDLTKEIRDKYNLSKRMGLGKATAQQLLENCSNVKQLFEKVVEAYKSYYGEEIYSFKSHRGEEMNYTWLDYLQENAILLYMRRKNGEMYDIRKTLKKLDIL